MTSGLVLDEFNLDLSPSGLLVGFGLVLVVLVVLAVVARVGVVDEGIVVGGSGVEVVTGALVGHVGGRDVGRLGHRLGVVSVGGGGGGSSRVLGRIGRGNLLVWKWLSRLASAKGHELVKRTAKRGRDGGRAPPIRTRTRNGEEV